MSGDFNATFSVNDGSAFFNILVHNESSAVLCRLTVPSASREPLDGRLVVAALTGETVTQFSLLSLSAKTVAAAGSAAQRPTKRAASGSGMFCLVYYTCKKSGDNSV